MHCEFLLGYGVRAVLIIMLWSFAVSYFFYPFGYYVIIQVHFLYLSNAPVLKANKYHPL